MPIVTAGRVRRVECPRTIRELLTIVWLAVMSAGLTSSTGAFAQESLVTVGLALPLSGDMARYGTDIQRGAIMAQEELGQRQIAI